MISEMYVWTIVNARFGDFLMRDYTISDAQFIDYESVIEESISLRDLKEMRTKDLNTAP